MTLEMCGFLEDIREISPDPLLPLSLCLWIRRRCLSDTLGPASPAAVLYLVLILNTRSLGVVPVHVLIGLAHSSTATSLGGAPRTVRIKALFALLNPWENLKRRSAIKS